MSNYCHKDTDKNNPEGDKFGICKDEIGNKKCKKDNDLVLILKKICTELKENLL